MRRWLALFAGVAALAVTGTALAMTATETPADEKMATETTVMVEQTTTTVEKPAPPEPVAIDEVAKGKEVKERLERLEPVEYEDNIPPAIEILYPVDGQVFETREVVFEGTSEAYARVFFGEKAAVVTEPGSWRIVLKLDKGENHIEATALDRSGNKATDSVTVIVQIPEEPKKEEPKPEPKKEEPKEQPKEEPKEDHVEWEFSAHQLYGACSENPPYDVFHGTGKPGTLIVIEAEFGRKTTEVHENGEWEAKIFFEGAPIGEAFPVWVVDKFGHEKVFEFVHTD
ncbi:MAG: hypothetical protein WBM90_01930 [Acidimicrobiia bacterium]